MSGHDGVGPGEARRAMHPHGRLAPRDCAARGRVVPVRCCSPRPRPARLRGHAGAPGSRGPAGGRPRALAALPVASAVRVVKSGETTRLAFDVTAHIDVRAFVDGRSQQDHHRPSGNDFRHRGRRRPSCRRQGRQRARQEAGRDRPRADGAHRLLPVRQARTGPVAHRRRSRRARAHRAGCDGRLRRGAIAASARSRAHRRRGVRRRRGRGRADAPPRPSPRARPSPAADADAPSRSSSSTPGMAASTSARRSPGACPRRRSSSSSRARSKARCWRPDGTP